MCKITAILALEEVNELITREVLRGHGFTGQVTCDARYHWHLEGDASRCRVEVELTVRPQDEATDDA